jgi:hypothetical protein
MKLLVVACLIALCASPARSEGRLGYQGEGKGPGKTGYASYAKALADMRRNPEVTMRTEKGWILAIQRGGREIWSFTPADHYAYPSFARRKAVQNGDGWRVQTSMQCESTKPLCDRLMREYIQLDRRMKEYFDGR